MLRRFEVYAASTSTVVASGGPNTVQARTVSLADILTESRPSSGGAHFSPWPLWVRSARLAQKQNLRRGRYRLTRLSSTAYGRRWFPYFEPTVAFCEVRYDI